MLRQIVQLMNCATIHSSLKNGTGDLLLYEATYQGAKPISAISGVNADDILTVRYIITLPSRHEIFVFLNFDFTRGSPSLAEVSRCITEFEQASLTSQCHRQPCRTLQTRHSPFHVVNNYHRHCIIHSHAKDLSILNIAAELCILFLFTVSISQIQHLKYSGVSYLVFRMRI